MILNAKNLKEVGELGACPLIPLKILWIMQQYAAIQYAIFKPYATSKMELFMAEFR